jgi:superfamily II DNA or RNA helicase
MLIADEAHNMGAGQIKKRLDQIKYGRRIGLSATPDRQYDISGNNAIKAFFNAEDKYTYEYGMKEAIDNGVLCKYYYYPHIVRLTGEEMNQYLDISIKIVKYITYHGNDIDKPDSALKKLLLARKRIIHKAEGKIAVFKKIIYDRLRESGCLKYTLVYVPEGNSPDTYDSDIFEDHEEIRDDELSNHLIDIYTKIVLDTEDTMTVKKFTSDSTDREEILKQFADGDIQVLTSMKCLDEGVDVPRSEMAIFCSSTGNPRQFIQRRGRILRKHKDKDFAIIHDFVVVPNISSTSDSYSLEQKLLKNELIRVKDFAQMSLNASDTQLALKEVMQYYKLNLYNNN